MSPSAGRLVILSGPSCVGKTPRTKALKRVYPDLAAKLTPLVLYNSRAPRAGEQSGRQLRASVAAALADAMNHATIEITMRYAHLSPEVKVNAVKTLDALYARPATDAASRSGDCSSTRRIGRGLARKRDTSELVERITVVSLEAATSSISC